MGGGALETNGLTNGETENSLHRQFSPAHAALDNSLSHASDAVADHDVPAKRARLQKELTFQDMYQNEGVFDEDDEDDSDWEPFQLHKCVEFEIKKWCCRNCTMINLDCNDCCYICGEHRESKILSHGFFASPLAQDDDLIEVQGDIKGLKDVGSQKSVANSSTAIGFDERMLLHAEVDKKSPPHPERPDRLQVIAASLSRAGIFPGKCYAIPAREITPEELITVVDFYVHSLEHIESVEVTTESLSSYFTPDTYANQHSALAARLAAGLCADLASAIVSGRAKNGFALVRPPGHHAGVRQAMGFCLHNNAAVAALAAQAAGARKVLILDWDVHHGNGTQEIFEHNKSVLYISLHRHEDGKFYPGTGAAEEVLDCRRNFKLKLMLLANLARFQTEEPNNWSDLPDILRRGVKNGSRSGQERGRSRVAERSVESEQEKTVGPNGRGLTKPNGLALQAANPRGLKEPNGSETNGKELPNPNVKGQEEPNDLTFTVKGRTVLHSKRSPNHWPNGLAVTFKDRTVLQSKQSLSNWPNGLTIRMKAKEGKVDGRINGRERRMDFVKRWTSAQKKGLDVREAPAEGRELFEALKDIEDHFFRDYNSGKEVGSMGAEGYCVNIPWSRGGVGDNDYNFAFQHVVLPIASEFNPDFIIVSAGFDAARGDPLGCCDITPSGYAHMTHVLNTLAGGKLLVILEGGYNLRSISSSATAVIKVLLGESPGCELENSFPSKAGLLTVLEVLKIQMKFWLSLGPIFVNLESQWRMYCFQKKIGNSDGIYLRGGRSISFSALLTYCALWESLQFSILEKHQF
ncbi:hypothetical protein LR48_Vigan01g265500 [Vigna angularis]|uniref:histone deacetylase n=1 Tax=Phaseolus angularis TaxID=3914 RepID=A0A0L9TSG6_PHAAN|nr:hypothetical protein LR48_Vigan01g265500 [Vigna angularis]